MCLNENYSRVRVGQHLCDMFPIQNDLKPDALSPFLFNFTAGCAIRSVQVNQESLKLNNTHHLLVYAGDVSIQGGSFHAIIKNTEALLVSKEKSLEVNTKKTMYMVMSREDNAGQNRNIKTRNKSFKRTKQFRYLGKTLTNHNSIQEEIKNWLK